MPEIDRLTGSSDSLELDFVEREAIPEPAMEAEANTAENWLQAFAFAWNQLI